MKRDTGKHRLVPVTDKAEAAKILDVENAELGTPIGGEFGGQVMRERNDRWNPKVAPRAWAARDEAMKGR